MIENEPFPSHGKDATGTLDQKMLDDFIDKINKRDKEKQMTKDELKESGLLDEDGFPKVAERIIEEQKRKNDKDTNELRNYRTEALKIAAETATKINHFEHQYSSKEELFADIDLMHEIADYNLKYIMGGK